MILSYFTWDYKLRYSYACCIFLLFDEMYAIGKMHDKQQNLYEGKLI